MSFISSHTSNTLYFNDHTNGLPAMTNPLLFFTPCFLIRAVILLSITLISACSGSDGNNDSSIFFEDGQSRDTPIPIEDELQNIAPYVNTSPYHAQLKSCALAQESTTACPLSTLPLLIEEADIPTVEQIMDRVLVSHPWMGQHFQAALETYPPEILQLFSAITSIVIDDDIRPSFYIAQTSTIYLDAANLWLTNAEKATVTRKEDYRSDFSNALNFLPLARYVENDINAWFFYSLEGDEERSLADIRLPLAELLLHELMHANDFFPPAHIPFLDQDLTIYEAFQSLFDVRIATQLTQDQPLQSTLLTELAGVMYLGNSATQELSALTAAEVGDAFEDDGASDDYAYTSIAEDAAMLFSEAMMKYLFDLDRDFAYTNRPDSDASCDEYVVSWGVRGRMGDDNVKSRAQFVVESVYLDRSFNLFFQNLEIPTMMRIDESWCDNLVLP